MSQLGFGVSWSSSGFRARIQCQYWGLDSEIFRFRVQCPNYGLGFDVKNKARVLGLMS